MSVLLQVRAEGAGWRLSVGPEDGAARSGTVSASTVSRLEAQAAAALAPRPGLALPGRDAAQSQAERALGRALWGAVREAGLDAVLARQLAQEQPAVIIIEAEAGEALPWELLADEGGEGLEETGQGVVVRRVPGPARAPVAPAGGLRVVGGGDDPTARELAAQLTGLGPPGPAVVHVVVHGLRVREGLLGLGDAGAAPDTLTHSLGPVLRAAGLVVLHVCDADGPGIERGLLQAAVGAGVPAVVAPRGPCAVRALERFAAALHRALDQGAPLVGALAAGRAAVRALASPRPDGRWHRLALFVTRGRALDWRPGRPPGGIAGIAAHEERLPALAPLLRAAADRAPGYLGLEHLAQQLPPERLGAAAHLVLRPVAVQVHPDRAPRPTPRLDRLLAALPPSARPEALAAAVVAGLRAWLGSGPAEPSPGGTTLELDPTGQTGQPAGALEVVGGPEDGLLISVLRGECVGRHSDRGCPEHALFATAGAWDPYLSRRHLRWLGEGWLELLRPGRSPSGRVLRGPVQLQVGQVIWLSPSTGVRGVVGPG